MRGFWSGAAAVFLAGSLSWGWAEVTVESVRWSHQRRDLDQWSQAPAAKVRALPRVVVRLVNRGPARAEGIVLRYAVAARISNIKNPPMEGAWVVPFWVSQQRVPFLKPGQKADISIGDLRLGTTLGELYRAGFWPDALKAEIMVQPRPGEDAPQKILEKVLPIVWRTVGK